MERTLYLTLLCLLGLQSIIHIGRATTLDEQLEIIVGEHANPQAFEKALEKGIELGLKPEGAIVSRLTYGIGNEEIAYLSELLPDLRKEAVALDLDATGMAFLNLGEALVAADSQDWKSAAYHFKEAFWLAPEYASQIASFVGDVKQQELLSSITLDMSLPVQDANGKSTTLAELVDGKKAILLDFWASWCGPCIYNMPGLRSKSEKWSPMGIVVAGMNTEGDPEIARTTQKDQNMQDVIWLVETESGNYSDLLHVTSIPTLVLLSAEGKVLKVGHPQDGDWDQALLDVSET